MQGRTSGGKTWAAKAVARITFAACLVGAIGYPAWVRWRNERPLELGQGSERVKIYRVVAASNSYDCLDNRGDWEAFYRGVPLAATWKPIRVEIDDHVGRIPDYPSLLGGVPVLSERAWKALRPLLGASVEALPLDCEWGHYFAINVLDHVDCLDYDRATVIRFRSSGRVMRVEKFAFKPGSLRCKHLFKLPETARSEVLASDSFKEVVEKAGLTGFLFEELGDAE